MIGNVSLGLSPYKKNKTFFLDNYSPTGYIIDMSYRRRLYHGDLVTGSLVGVNIRSSRARKFGLVSSVLHGGDGTIMSAIVYWNDGSQFTCHDPTVLEILCK